MSKSIIFLVKWFLGNFYIHLTIFSGHTAPDHKLEHFTNLPSFLTCHNHANRNQCDQIGRLLKGLDSKFYFKSSPNIWKLFGHFEKHLKQKLLCPHFWQILNKLGYFLIHHQVTLITTQKMNKFQEDFFLNLKPSENTEQAVLGFQRPTVVWQFATSAT